VGKAYLRFRNHTCYRPYSSGVCIAAEALFVVVKVLLRSIWKVSTLSGLKDAGEGRSLTTDCAVASVRNLTLADHVLIQERWYRIGTSVHRMLDELSI
jgi:hypothetical protein